MSASNVIELSKKTGAGATEIELPVTYLKDETGKVVGVTHPDWPFTITRNQHTKSETAFVCDDTDEPFGIIDSDQFNTILMCWLLIDDPNLIDEAASTK